MRLPHPGSDKQSAPGPGVPLERLQVNSEKAARSEQAVFDDLETLCATSGFVHALAAIAVRDNMIVYAGAMTPAAMATSYARERTVRTEFTTLLGLMIKHPVDFSAADPKVVDDLVTRASTLLEELHDRLRQPMFDAIIGGMRAREAGLEVPAETIFARGDVLREPIFYGGESAYSFQFLELALQRYTPDDGWLRANRGFGIAEAHAVARAMGRLPTTRLSRLLPGRRKDPDWARNALDAFALTLEEIAAEARVGTDVAQDVLDAFTAPASPTNAEFKALGDFNLAAACPLVRTPDGRYLSLQSYGLYESLYDSPFYWMHADAGYRAEASKHRGAFTEDFVARRLAEVFGPARVHRGVAIKRGTKHVTDIDVLVTFADRAIVLQCKSKKLTLAARKGNDLQLRSDFKKSVQDAYDQARVSADSLLDPSLTFLDAQGAPLAVSKLRTIYPVCVVSDSYPALTVQARSFLTHTADETVRPPIVTDVFLIDVMAEMLSSPLRLLSYVDRRVSYTGRLNSMNEHAILGFHLSQNLWLEEEYSMAMIDDACATDLDAAMTVRREGVPGSPTPDGVLTRFARTPVGRILAAIEHRESVAEVDLGFLLLTLGETALKDLGKGLEAVAARTRKDGRTHDFTHIFAEGEAGLTVHCSPLPNAKAIPELRRHCENRKYIHRAGAWHGLLVRAEDGLPKLGIELRFPWKPDAALDTATRAVVARDAARKAAAPGAAAGRRAKLGRNDPCPCGSGRKHKRCCLT